MKMRRVSQCENPPKGRTHIHNVRFYNLQPRSIHCMAYNTIWKKLAVSRNDGSIEIWDVRHAPCLERTIPKSPQNSVEGLAWSAERLFSAGLNGELVEWNLQTLQPRFKQHVTGNAIWCIDVNREGNEMAIGTEEGYINIFNIEDNQFQYKTLFDKQEGRVLCCRFDATGNFLVTGSMGAIRIWDTRTGHAIHKMTVTSMQYPQDTIVWSIQVLQDFTIISGDSRGHVSIWDGKTASQLETHQALKADVLAVAVNEEEDKLFCAGIEPTIRIYAKTQIKRDDMMYYRWVKFLQRRVHDHDVKALVCAQDNIYSGGVDGYLGISSATKTRSTIHKYGPFLQQPCVTISPAERLVLLSYAHSLEIWRMGSTNGSVELGHQEQSKTEPKLLSLLTIPEKLLEFKSRNEERIVCSTLSPNGRWLCYSTHSEIRLFHFVPGTPSDEGGEGGDENKRETKLIRVKDLPEQMEPASHVQFTADSMRLIVVNRKSKHIMIFAMLENVNERDLNISTTPPLDFVEFIDTSKHIKDSIKLFTVSVCGSYIAAASTDRSIAVWSVYKGKHFKHLLNLPRYTAATTALSIHAEQPRVVAAFADGKIFEYDLEEMCFTCSDVDRFVANSEYYCIENILLDPRNPNIFVMQNDSKLFVLEKCKAREKIEDAVVENSKKKSLKKMKTHDDDETKVYSLRLKMEKTYENLLYLGWLSSDELITVSANPTSLIERLPSPFKEKLFRTM
ncbi:U3 small nucleolar RNA-associated protein 4 homolog [Musca vetustissima]|uniref:U3 small nucleolar RNA-associated protein 4 homolog n=1 Tax=Musca vetustissima TaxID=27455 RepID=UPI002AB71168|nr:U3 small nucleolar RNA-associated protein 4 homolog [Musca vetustissima]